MSIGAADDFRIRIVRPDHRRRKLNKIEIFFHIRTVRPEAGRIRFIPYLIKENFSTVAGNDRRDIILPCHPCLRREKRRIARRVVAGRVAIEPVSVTQAEPWTDSLFEKIADNPVEPGKIVFSLFRFRSEPAGQNTGVFDACFSCKTVKFRGVIPHLPFDAFESDAYFRGTDLIGGAG